MIKCGGKVQEVIKATQQEQQQNVFVVMYHNIHIPAFSIDSGWYVRVCVREGREGGREKVTASKT